MGKWSQSVESPFLWSNSSSLLISCVVLGHLLALASFLVEQSHLGCGCEQAWPHHSRPGPSLAVSPQPILHTELRGLTQDAESNIHFAGLGWGLQWSNWQELVLSKPQSI